MEIAASESEARFRVMVERAPEAIIVYDLDLKRIMDANAKAEQLFGCSREKLLKLGLEHFYAPQQPDGEDVGTSVYDYGLRAVAGEEVVLERLVHSDDGRDLTCEVRLVRLPYGRQRLVRGSLTDITGRKRADAALRASLDEKTVLLKEVHHRVKNNLQIVSSLLSLQANRVQNPLALETLQDTQNRVRSMALIHETLYRSQNLAQVNFAAYVERLCAHLLHAFAVDAKRIHLVGRVTGGGLELDEAVPCGLIINELVSNSIKHAFPAGRVGEITLDLDIQPGGMRTLRVADNGAGLPPGTDLRQTGTLGLQLVSNLADQLGGTLELERSGGTAFRLTFQAPVNHNRP
jgi:PAS domain S-box-containing protein